MAQSRRLVIGILASVLGDDRLLQVLEKKQISKEEIDLARARLVFQATAEMARRDPNDAMDLAIRSKVKQQLGALSHMVKKSRLAK